MFTGRKQHYHHPLARTQDVLGLGTPRGVRFFADDDEGGDGNGGQGGGTGGDGKSVTMTQQAFDAIVRDAKAQARRSEREIITAKYGDLDTLKAKAEATDGNTSELQKELDKATARIQDLTKKVTDYEAEKAQAERLDTIRKALTDAGMKPELADVLNLKGTTPEELKAELEAVKPVVGATGSQQQPPAPAFGGNPANTGDDKPANLSEAIGSHYKA